MTKVVFENATIRDVIGKAGRIAPTKGSAFDKANGILIEVNAPDNQVVVKATNTDIFYMEIADAVSIEGDSTVWRLPSSIIDGICSKLPITSGKSVTFDDSEGSSLKVTSGRMRATVRIVDHSYYPDWGPFDPSDLEAVPNFGSRIQMVQWAASKSDGPPLSGIHLDGESVVATNRFRIAVAPCKADPIFKPVTVPATIFTPLMKTLGDVAIGIEDGQLLIQPDESTQIRAVIYANDYPNAKAAFRRDETGSATFKRTSLLEIIDRAMVMAQRDRTPLLKMIIGREEIAVMMTDKEVGLLGDVIEVPGFAVHERITICFTPDNLTGGLQASPNEEVTMFYHTSDPMKPVRLDGGSGYEVLVMPRKEVSEGE